MAFKMGSVFTISFKWWGSIATTSKFYYPDDSGDAYDAWEWDNMSQTGDIPEAGTAYDSQYDTNSVAAKLAGQFVAPVNCRLIAIANVYDFFNPSNLFTKLRMGAFKAVFAAASDRADDGNWTSLGYIDSTTQTGNPLGYCDAATALFNTTDQDISATDVVGFVLETFGASASSTYGCTTAVFRIT